VVTAGTATGTVTTVGTGNVDETGRRMVVGAVLGATVVVVVVTGVVAAAVVGAGAAWPPEQAARPTVASTAAATNPDRRVLPETRAAGAGVRCSRPVSTGLALADVGWAVVMAVVALALLVVAVRMNARTRPHRRAEDGSWFTCEVQLLSNTGAALGDWRPARAELVAGGLAITGTVAGAGLPPGDDPRPVVGRAPEPPRGYAVFLVGGDPFLALRVPASAPTVAELDALRIDR
jgi:hypothetical protein